MNKLYVLIVDEVLPFDKVAFHNYINSLYPNFIGGWWHYLTGTTYIIQTSLDADGLYKKIYPGIPGRHMLVVEVNADNKQGWLPQKAWDWINTQKP